jgi:hypothetical protein
MPGLSAIWVGRARPTADDPYRYETIESAWIYRDVEYATAAEAIAAWNEDQRQQLLRDRVGEALRRLFYGLIRPLWRDLPEERRNTWRRTADVVMRLLRSFGVRIELADKTDG